MKLNRFVSCGAALVMLGAAVSSQGFRAPDRPPLPNFDTRQKPSVKSQPASAAQEAATRKLRSLLPSARVDFDPVTKGPKFVTGGNTFLTGPSAAGKGVPAASAALFAAAPHAATKAFIHVHQDLFGFGPEALDKAVVKRDTTAAYNGVQTVIWQQQVADIPLFEAKLVSHTTKDGELVSISSGFIANPEAAAGARKDRIASLPVSAQQAIVFAARNVGEQTTVDTITPDFAPAAQEPTRRQRFRAPGLNGTAEASLVWLPMDSSTLQLAWEVICTSKSRGEMFRVLVDAESGKILLRHCLTEYLTDATYRVYPSDSPAPFSPGWSTPNSTQPPLVPRQLVTLSALNTNASPGGWIPDGGNETRGNNVDAHTDTNSDDVPDLPRPQGTAARVFDFPMDLATEDPSGYRPAAVVQLFYLNNWMHDRLYELGFTEDAGNFQNDNFGRGGLGNDALQADAQDGSGTDNANFSTPDDGSPPRMQMFVFTRPTPKRDGDLDAEIVLHEYTHGLSYRHVNGGGGLSALQSRGMGEGWSDFYALALLSQPGDDVNGCYAAGAYASYLIGSAADNRNYYFGIRRYPYSTDTTKNPLTFNDIDPTQADYCSSGAPFHTEMFGNCGTGSADEVHAQGEVWCVTLWEARARLIAKYGWEAGNHLILQLVTDGMLYTPANPNFLQARDGILAADLANTGGANLSELWTAFAKRGMGLSAISPSSSTVTGVQESFDTPDDLRVLPLSGFVSKGPVGGPFTVSGQTFTLTNASTNAVTWVLTNHSAWLTASPTTGSLLPGGPSTVVTANLNLLANWLPAGIYPASLLFTNLDTRAGQKRDFVLRVGQPDYFTELFEGKDNDLAYSTFTFTPDGSSSFYFLCREPASAFPTDPANGTPVSLTDDDFAQASLNGVNVSLYGQRTNVFFIGSNGYLTLNSGDNTWTESLSSHFNRPRISALFHDQLPVGQTVISWKQLSDHVAVTYQGLSDINQTGLNDFQIEWFYSGQIRITYLGISNRHNLAGLSAGRGIPSGFAESDFSQAGTCSPIQVLIPSLASEGSGVLANAGVVTLPIPAATNVSVSLLSSDSTALTVPALVDIPPGQTSGTFPITIVDDLEVDGSRMASITAWAFGFGSASQHIIIQDNEAATMTIALPANVVEGQMTAQGEVAINPPSTAGVVVNLTSSDTNKLSVAPAVLIPPGTSNAYFPISVAENITAKLSEVLVTAHVDNWRDAVATVTVLSSANPVTIEANPGLITIPESGAASVYPSVINVTGVPGTVSKLTVTVSNIFHTFPGDIGIMLVGPTGTNLVLLANAGGGVDANGVTLTFDDQAASRIATAGPLVSGTFRPTSISPGRWPAPAPTPSAESTLAAFAGSDPNGIWRLYVYDDSPVDSGRINDGWSLTMRTRLGPAPSPALRLPSVSAQAVQLMFETAAGHIYFVESTDDPSSAVWFTLDVVVGDGAVATVKDSPPATQRFYRLRVQ